MSTKYNAHIENARNKAVKQSKGTRNFEAFCLPNDPAAFINNVLVMGRKI